MSIWVGYVVPAVCLVAIGEALVKPHPHQSKCLPMEIRELPKRKEHEYIRVRTPQLRTFSECGVVKPLGNGMYVITELGEGYLDGEISTDEDEPDEIRENGGEENNDGVPSPGGI